MGTLGQKHPLTRDEGALDRTRVVHHNKTGQIQNIVVPLLLGFDIYRQPKQEEVAAAERTAVRQQKPEQRFLKCVSDADTSKIDRSAMGSVCVT